MRSLLLSVSHCLLLLGHTHSASSAAGGLGVLTAHAQAPVVSQAAVGADLLESLEVLTQLVVQLVGQHLAEATILHVLLSVQEPVGDLVLSGVAHHCHNALNLLL